MDKGVKRGRGREDEGKRGGKERKRIDAEGTENTEITERKERRKNQKTEKDLTQRDSRRHRGRREEAETKNGETRFSWVEKRVPTGDTMMDTSAQQRRGNGYLWPEWVMRATKSRRLSVTVEP